MTQSEAEQAAGETGGMDLSPAVLWGILTSECKGGSMAGWSSEAEGDDEDEDGSLYAPPSWMSQYEPGFAHSNNAERESLAGQNGGPAILWGILLSEMTPQVTADEASNLPGEVLDMKAAVDL